VCLHMESSSNLEREWVSLIGLNSGQLVGNLKEQNFEQPKFDD